MFSSFTSLGAAFVWLSSLCTWASKSTNLASAALAGTSGPKCPRNSRSRCSCETSRRGAGSGIHVLSCRGPCGQCSRKDWSRWHNKKRAIFGVWEVCNSKNSPVESVTNIWWLMESSCWWCYFISLYQTVVRSLSVPQKATKQNKEKLS